MENLLVIAVVGLPGSGKSEVVSRCIRHDFYRIGFNDVYNEEFDKLGVKRGDEVEERKIREELRREFGMDFAARQALPKIEEAIAQGRQVVVDSLYSWEEFIFMKDKFGGRFRVLAVWAPPDLRYERLAQRPERSLARETAMSRDYSQIANSHQAGPIAMADWTIQNTGSLAKLLREVDELIEKIT